jgi:hypothetical protein
MPTWDSLAASICTQRAGINCIFHVNYSPLLQVRRAGLLEAVPDEMSEVPRRKEHRGDTKKT